MRRFQVRWSNFRSLEDTGWLHVKPITVVVGSNAAGKTSLIAPLLLMKQTADSVQEGMALKTQGELFNAGSFRNLVFSHRSDRELKLEIRFHHRKRTDPDAPRKLETVPEHPPGSVALSFGAGEKGAGPVLSRFLIRDIYGRAMLNRRRLKNGSFSLTGSAAPKRGTDFARSARRAKPEHFMFTIDNVFREQYIESTRKTKQRRKKGEEKPDFGYLTTLTYASQAVNNILSKIAYIGPLRERPRRLYEISGERPATVGTRGEDAPELIFRDRRSKLLRNINTWISEFEFGMQLICTELTEGAFNLTLRRTASSPIVNFADTGFGLSQVLPLIVQGCTGSEETLLITEQPEIHLNPRLQTKLGDLFAHIASRGMGVLVETHSEHLVLRLRRLIAEKKIKATDVALYFAERDRDTSTITEVPIAPNGHIDSKDWPKGFFDESLKESLALAAAQSE